MADRAVRRTITITEFEDGGCLIDGRTASGEKLAWADLEELLLAANANVSRELLAARVVDLLRGRNAGQQIVVPTMVPPKI